MKYNFRWIAWNVDHIGRHGIAPAEAEYVVEHPWRGYPARIENDKTLVRGQTGQGRFVQVIYLIDEDSTIFIIHARPLTAAEKGSLKRR